MAPLSSDLPKPMMPLHGTPLIRHLLERLHTWGVSEVLINLHHNPGPLVDHLRQTPIKGLHISFSFEPELLGTGGVLRRAEWFLKSSREPFWLTNTDIAINLSPTLLLQTMMSSRSLATLWLHALDGPRTIETKGNTVTSFRSRTPGTTRTATFTGLHLLSPRIIRFLPQAESFCSIIDIYERAMTMGERIRGVVVPGASWIDCGTPAGYLEAHQRTAPSRRRPAQCLHAHASATISPDATITNTVVWQQATITRRARLKNAIVGRNARVTGAAQGMVLPATALPQDTALALALKHLRWRPAAVTACYLPGRGSDRRFIRLSNGARHVMLVAYGTKRPENAHYADHAIFLHRRNIPVPHVLHHDNVHRATIMQDLGDLSLEEAASDVTPRRLASVYRRVVDVMLCLHRISPTRLPRSVSLEPAFTPALYRWEHNLFLQCFLLPRFPLRRPRLASIERELSSVATTLHHQPRVLLHRDFQSSNVLLHGSQPYLIDFQGMRAGPAAYDLASLLCDPYVMLPQTLQERLLLQYAAHGNAQKAAATAFRMAAIQRLTQALGAFGRLAAHPATAHFSRHIAPALEMLSRVLASADDLPHLHELTSELIATHTVCDSKSVSFQGTL